MIKSMTGYGGAKGSAEGLSLSLIHISVIERTLAALDESEWIDEIVVATQSEKITTIAALARERGIRKLKCVVEGGADRTASAWAGVRECSERAELIAIHDAVSYTHLDVYKRQPRRQGHDTRPGGALRHTGRYEDQFGNTAAARSAGAAFEAFPRFALRAEADSGGDSHLRRRRHDGGEPSHDGVEARAGSVFRRRGAGPRRVYGLSLIHICC